MGRRHKPVSLGGAKPYPPLAPGAEDATPERLGHAVRTGAVEAEEGVRRFADPLDLLRKRQILDRHDAGANDRLWEIGERFRRHWHRSRLDNLTAFDFSREIVDGAGGQGGTPTEAATRHRAIVRKAEEAVGPRLLPILTGIVIEARPAAALVHLIQDTGHLRTAETLVVERLRECLHRLGEHWGMMDGGPNLCRPTRGVSPGLSRG